MTFPKLKTTGVGLLSIGLLSTFLFGFVSSQNEGSLLIAGLILLSLAISFLGASFIFMIVEISRRQKAKYIFLVISLVLIALGLISRYSHWTGSSMEVVFGILGYCFFYAPLELFDKYHKWLAYSKNKIETLLLSSLDFVGINLVLLGLLMTMLHWPGNLNLVYAGAAVLLVGLFLWNSRFKSEVIRRKKSEDTIAEQYRQIEHEKALSEALLLNILPQEVAEELKTKGHAEAKYFSQVTVLFTDFKDFTKISETMSPKELVEEIDTCFKAFDHIVEKYQVEKIKTIGDSYLCVGGLPVESETHALDTVKVALEMRDFIQLHSAQRRASGKSGFDIRIGIHSGPVVAGIVGVKKYAYDIWGDTVNTASRMESSGEIGKINISGTTYELVKEHFHCIPRGKIVAKNKGEIDMFFVESVTGG